MKTLLSIIFILSTTTAFAGINKKCESITISEGTKCKTNKLYWVVGLDFSFHYTCHLKNPIEARKGTIRSSFKEMDFETSFACEETLKDLSSRDSIKGSDDALPITKKIYKSVNEVSYNKLKVTTVGNKSLLEHIGHTSNSSSLGKTYGSSVIKSLASKRVENFEIEDLRNGDVIEAFGLEFQYK